MDIAPSPRKIDLLRMVVLIVMACQSLTMKWLIFGFLPVCVQ
jgi:hypothetical protein